MRERERELSLGSICLLGAIFLGLQVRPVGPDQIREGLVEAKHHVL